MARRLGPEERALWEKVIATVRPLHRQAEPDAPPAGPQVGSEPKPAPAQRPGRTRPAPPPAPPPPRPHAAATLDGSWDRRISRGLVQPDFTVDLHGHNLDSAWRMLDTRLELAIASGARVILLVTGKPPTGERWPVARGAIRAAVGDWLAVSRHSRDIAAVRNAHPRHGGAGALYLILRRPKGAAPD